MRLHQLTVTAFGPFAGTESVDFDELNDAGLFLLTGPTGAGKSSLLDAVCFALYGTVPGARGTKTLKSQHAAVDVPPEVVLDFSVRGRRFVVRRSPEWSRPKRRGDGLLTEKASASILETTGGSEHFLSSRAAEVGLLVTDLMGMNAGQFVQVALLPQGEFQTFLRASSQERHDVLQHLFRTDRFARIEEWVHEHSRGLRERSGRDRADVQRLVETVAERSELPVPEELAGDELAQAAADDRLLPWVRDRLEEARAAADAAGSEHQTVRDHLMAVAAEHTAGLRRHEQRQRCAEAEAVLAGLDASSAEAAAGARALEAGERAARCHSVLAILDEVTAAAAAAALEREAALRSLAVVLPGAAASHLDAASLGELLEETRSQATRLETLLPREATARAAQRDLVTERARLAADEQELAALVRRADDIPAEIATLTADLDAARVRADRRDACAHSLAAAQERHLAAAELAVAHRDVAALADAHRDARDRELTAREHRQDLSTRRLAGMAAELAERLADGDACQVCGSTAHPRPARAAEDAVTEADQAAAEELVAALTADLQAATQALRDAEHRRDGFDAAREGRTVEQAGAEVADLVDALADAELAVVEVASLRDSLETTRTELDTLTRRQATVAASVAGRRQVVSGLEDTVAAVAAELADATGEAPLTSLRDTVAGLEGLVDALATARRVLEVAERTAERAEEARRQADQVVTDHGFATVQEAQAALLDTATHDRLRDLLDQRARAELRARAVLDDAGSSDADEPVPDLHALTEALDGAEAAVAGAARRLHLAEATTEAIRSALDRLEAAITAWAPLRDESLRAEAMARLVRGMGHDNQLQMRLSAYVLATRLDQVVAAANERLGHMRDQRYLLQRTDRVARKGSQAGLGLEIVDQWTGDARDPATLSGGETFVVSLSLALGLADVVTQEAGGTEIETLFVDEGFGTLDADTLDDVMDRLDGLRAGGRTVGVVSHVSELRNRIPTQVHVEKGRSGSTIAVTTLVG